MSMPSSVMSTSAPRLLTRGMVSSRSRWAVNGAVSASTCSSSAAMVAPSWSMWVSMSRARVADRAEAGHNLWYACRHHAFGGSVQVLADPTGFPLWDLRDAPRLDPQSDRRPGAGAARAVPARRPRAAGAGRQGLPRRRDRRAHRGAATGRRRRAAHRHRDLQPADHRHAGTDRTRAHPARPLAGTRPRHRLPAMHRHHRRRRPGAHLNAARPLVRKPHYWEWLTARAFGRLPRRHRTRPRALHNRQPAASLLDRERLPAFRDVLDVGTTVVGEAAQGSGHSVRSAGDNVGYDHAGRLEVVGDFLR